jgi:prepilin-type N-terminal cleavage/methylation domain-containing protein
MHAGLPERDVAQTPLEIPSRHLPFTTSDGAEYNYPMIQFTHPRSAFSLIELSIVLVILGLLAGGILAGKSLIRASELRSAATDFNRYKTATLSFRDKYFGLPGDITNATAFWGAADNSTGNTAACQTTASTDSKTCNGNGDARIATSTASAESYRFWQQLANAGIIEGSFTGVPDAAGTAAASNSPSGRIGTSLWYPFYAGVANGSVTTFDGSYNNVFQFGGYHTYPAYNSILKPEEAWNIDSKLDDGQPGTGMVRAKEPSGFSGLNCTTATASSQVTAAYYLPQTVSRCILIFPQAY